MHHRPALKQSWVPAIPPVSRSTNKLKLDFAQLGGPFRQKASLVHEDPVRTRRTRTRLILHRHLLDGEVLRFQLPSLPLRLVLALNQDTDNFHRGRDALYALRVPVLPFLDHYIAMHSRPNLRPAKNCPQGDGRQVGGID